MRKSSLNSVLQLAKQDARVLFIGSDLGVGTLSEFQQTFPDRFFMEGIAEQNLIGMAAGLAMDGFIPYVNTIASFLTRRCLEQIVIDLGLHNLPVRLIGNGGGLVYAPLGPTHLAPDDLGLMRMVPNMTVVAPSDAKQMQAFMAQTLDWPGPIYIRLGKGGDRVVWPADEQFTIGRAVSLRAGGDVALLTTGIMAQRGLEAAEILAGQDVDCEVIHLHTVKPLDGACLSQVFAHFPLVVTMEEHSRIGGLGSAVGEFWLDLGGPWGGRLLCLALPDRFIHHYGSQEELLAWAGLDGVSIAKTVADAWRACGGKYP